MERVSNDGQALATSVAPTAPTRAYRLSSGIDRHVSHSTPHPGNAAAWNGHAFAIQAVTAA